MTHELHGFAGGPGPTSQHRPEIASPSLTSLHQPPPAWVSELPGGSGRCGQIVSSPDSTRKVKRCPSQCRISAVEGCRTADPDISVQGRRDGRDQARHLRLSPAVGQRAGVPCLTCSRIRRGGEASSWAGRLRRGRWARGRVLAKAGAGGGNVGELISRVSGRCTLGEPLGRRAIWPSGHGIVVSCPPRAARSVALSR